MSPDQIATILWRRRLSLAATFVLCVLAVACVTLLLPKEYTATATLYVGGKVPEDTFVATDLFEQHTRTYATLAGNPNLADLVVPELRPALTRSQLLSRMSFAPVEGTQLLQITATGGSETEAQTIANAYATTFVTRMRELFRSGRAPAEIAVSEPAALPTSPSKPNPPLYLGLGLLLSLFLALGVALLRDRFDSRIRVAPEDDSILEQPIIARIPTLDARDARRARAVSDRFALLKTNIDFVDEERAQVILFTSPGVGEGKSTISANLALACAEDGERVVLVEGDLRRPGLSGTVVGAGAVRPARGLSNYLAGAAAMSEVIVAHPHFRGLSVIWSGLVPPNPTALLGSQRLETLFAGLRADFDRVIVDTGPIAVAADASVLAAHVDGSVFVIDEQATSLAEARAGLNQLRGVRGRILGVVLNRASLVGVDPYYYADESERQQLVERPESP